MGFLSNIFGTSLQTPATAKTTDSKRSVSSSRSVPTLSEGEIFRGEVTDLHRSDVTVTLEDGRSLHARLSSATELSIGQEATFLVQNSDESQITLKLLPDGDSGFEEAAIDKALTASNLPLTDNNVAVARALIDAGLPASRELLHNLLRYSASNKGVELSTLTALMKNKIPVTKENAASLQACRNFEHRLVSQASQLTSQLMNALQSPEAGDLFGYDLVNAFFGEDAFPEDASSPTVFEGAADSSVLAENASVPSDGTVSGAAVPVTADALFSQNSDSSASNVSGTPATDRGASSVVSDFGKASSGNASAANTSAVTESGTPSAAEKKNASAESFLDARSFSGKNIPLKDRLTARELTEAAGALEEYFPQEKDLQTFLGTQTAPALFSALAKNASRTPKRLSDILSKTPVLSQLLSDSVLSEFLLKPEDLSESNAVAQFYERLRKNLDAVSHLTKESGADSFAGISKTTGKMQENLRFMNVLNQIFPYVQLPLQMTRQLTHGELYVYANKKQRPVSSDSVSVLLHLDMDNLGPTDVYVALRGKSVEASFYLNDDASQKIISSEMNQLSEALSQKGFSFTGKVLAREKDPDPIRDLMLGENNVSMKRYRFDIRA